MGKLSNLKIESLNANSIGKFPKRNQLFNYLKKRDTHIFCIVDTRIDPLIENTVRTEWGAECFFSSYSSQQRGVAVFLKKDTPIKVNIVNKDNSGNRLQLLITFEMQDILLSVVYGPNDDSPNFHEEVFSLEETMQIDHSIYVGDWNMTLSQEMDTLNYVRENNPRAKELVLKKIEHLGLSDIWRKENPETKRFTWFKKDSINGPKCSRLDFF